MEISAVVFGCDEKPESKVSASEGHWDQVNKNKARDSISYLFKFGLCRRHLDGI
jgi:hypothetical protein